MTTNQYRTTNEYKLKEFCQTHQITYTGESKTTFGLSSLSYRNTIKRKGIVVKRFNTDEAPSYSEIEEMIYSLIADIREEKISQLGL